MISKITENITSLTLEDLTLPCLTKKVTGWECLACGGQRSIIALIEGDIILSLKMFPALIPLILVGIIALLPKSIFDRINVNRKRFFSITLYGILALTIIGYILRNTFFAIN